MSVAVYCRECYNENNGYIGIFRDRVEAVGNGKNVCKVYIYEDTHKETASFSPPIRVIRQGICDNDQHSSSCTMSVIEEVNGTTDRESIKKSITSSREKTTI